MASDALEHPSRHDWELLTEKARRVTYRPGEVILAEGAYRPALFIIRAGVARVEQAEQGRGIALAQLGPGELVGEMGFVEDTSASASVVAQEEVEVEVIEGAHVQALLASSPSFAARFYQSLAVSLARRLRATTRRLAQSSVPEAAQLDRFRQPRTGNISAQQVPRELAAAVDAFEQALLGVDQGLRGRTLDGERARERVSAACDEIVLALRRLTEDESLIEIGWDDLLAFRDTVQLESGVGDYVFRETFPLLMLSATLARCYTRPRGFPDDYETIAMIYHADPEGDDRLGPLIDHWFLERPFCRSRRASWRQLAAQLADLAGRHRGPGPWRVTSLASGTAEELFELVAQGLSSPLYATCLDVDAQALAAAARRAEAGGHTGAMAFLQGNALRLAEGQEQVALPPQQVIYALGLCDYLDDAAVVALLDWAHDHLADGGAAIVSNLDRGNPDREFLAHVLEWKLNHRAPDDLRDLFARSRFGDAPLDVRADETGVTLLATCARRG